VLTPQSTQHQLSGVLLRSNLSARSLVAMAPGFWHAIGLAVLSQPAKILSRRANVEGIARPAPCRSGGDARSRGCCHAAGTRRRRTAAFAARPCGAWRYVGLGLYGGGHAATRRAFAQPGLPAGNGGGRQLAYCSALLHRTPLYSTTMV
jgi:hypothetical protein